MSWPHEAAWPYEASGPNEASANRGGRIPRLVHAMWLDKTELDNEGPPPEHARYRSYLASWQQHNADYEFRFWNLRRVQSLFEDERLRRWRPLWYRMTKWIERCDFARYAVLYLHGGVYHDLDFICRMNIDPLLAGRELGLVKEPAEHHDPEIPGREVANNLLMSAPGHWFWRELMDDILANYDPLGRVIVMTGPTRLLLFTQRIASRLPPNTWIETCLVFPKAWGDQPPRECPRNVAQTAFFDSSWHDGTNWQRDGGLEYGDVTPAVPSLAQPASAAPAQGLAPGPVHADDNRLMILSAPSDDESSAPSMTTTSTPRQGEVTWAIMLRDPGAAVESRLRQRPEAAAVAARTWNAILAIIVLATLVAAVMAFVWLLWPKINRGTVVY